MTAVVSGVKTMTAKEIYDHFIEQANKKWTETCDGLIAGDENKVVRKVGVCFKLTAEVIEKAVRSGIDMIITHEPTFSHGDDRKNAAKFDLKKWEMLDQSGLVVYRLHDHAHDTEPDYIHAGFIRALNLKIAHQYDRESLGVCRYELEEPTTTRKLAALIKEKLGVEFVRIVGKKDSPVKTICLGLGEVGFDQINCLIEPGCDVFITGEVGEVCVCEYIRDACYFGENKSILLLGHCSSEYAGMRLLAEELKRTMIDAEYIHCGEVYSGI